jgi:hypothetical protein
MLASKMEQWNIGILEGWFFKSLKSILILPLTHYSIIPSFQIKGKKVLLP